MEVKVQQEDFNRILDTAEVLIDEVEHVLSQDDLTKKRLDDIKSGKIIGKSEEELDNYLKSRGVKVE